ncbi:MAG: ABC transporter ATP-binding protein [Chloroflexi bacterium]|nr:ABC transporter ATP-binding protein [Chloroflexota bacterium]MCH8868639.1 ABC transporter ATP-binding protein [Chloroflexota bacterium]MCH9039143.1 ABC transporter ATP-binding protein [Chloroflexota bacterium]MCI0791185.1 ABC transporter ATP-binding protein [Chloroflexota bacterium]MCI0822429.1 ABC transporter ATP-binding protein [Chloroflexota bacterium]
MPNLLLEIRDLHTYFKTKEGTVKAVNGVSLQMEENSILGLVGESGSGKTMTALSVLQLVPYPGKVVQGSIKYHGREMLTMSQEEMRHIRGMEISLIFQDASNALNPVIAIGKQVEEILREHTNVGRREARYQAIDLLQRMGIPDADDMLKRFPFQLSGGMAQRVMLAIGVALKPKLLLADEPTSSLDVTLQAEILQRLRELRRENGTSILLITHDLGVIAQMADAVAVMYGGMIVEYADTRSLFAKPLHPYTWGLFQALPRMDTDERVLKPIRGIPARMLDPVDQCPFLERCPKALNRCRTQGRPPLIEVEPGHKLACYNPMVYD